MLLQISHKTTYTYDAPINYALQQVRLTPLAIKSQKVIAWEIDVEGGKTEVSYCDHHGNDTHLINVDAGGQEVSIIARGKVETFDTSGIIGHINGGPPLWYFQQPTALTQPGETIKRFADQLRDENNTLDALHRLSALVLDQVSYVTESTYVATTAEQAAQGGNGVCQDHAQIFVAAARQIGVPARYISGYLMIDGQTDQDASHAWAEAHIDGLGWVGFDVSNGMAPDERYVRLAAGRDYHDAAPFSGMRIGSAEESMIVSLQVQQ